MSTPFSVQTQPSFVSFRRDFWLTEHRKELAVRRVLEQAFHRSIQIRPNLRDVDAQLGMALLLDRGVGLGIEAETRR